MSEARWYTAARRFPQLIGRTPDGSKVPFGPHTILQIVTFGFMVLLLWNTTWLWARFSLIGNGLLALLLMVGPWWLAGRMPYRMRNPMVAIGGWWSAVQRASAGAQPVVKLRKPRVAAGQVVMITDWTPAAEADESMPAEVSNSRQPAEPSIAPTVEPDVASPPAPALTGVQRLLAQNPHLKVAS